MKKLFFLVAAALTCAAPAMAQYTPTVEKVKIDPAAIKKSLEKSDADIANPKRNTKAFVWNDRGAIYYEAGTAASKRLHKGMDLKTFEAAYDKTTPEMRTIEGQDYSVYVYPNFDAYFIGDKLDFWNPKLEIYPNALEVAYEAYDKSYQLDNKAGNQNKVKDGMSRIANAYKQDADNYYSLRATVGAAEATALTVKTADAFMLANKAQSHPTVNNPDPASVFNAGLLYTITKEYEKGITCLREAAKSEYYSDGDVYYYLFHCYYGMQDKANAKQMLLDGVAKFPGNVKILEGLTGLYASGEGDPKEVVAIVEDAIAKNPDNSFLWTGLGAIYDKLDNSEKAMEAFNKAVSLDSKDYMAWLNIGYLNIKKAEAMVKEFNEKEFTNQMTYNQELKKVNDQYALSIKPLENAYNINNNSEDAVSMLRTICFRLREEPGMQDKYDKYDAIYKAMKGR